MPETLEQRRARSERDRDKINAQKRAWRALNSEKVNEQHREWLAANREKVLAQRRARWARDREKFREQRVRDREKRRDQAMYQKHGMRAADWAALWDAQGGRCYLCAEELVESQTVVEHDHSCCGDRKSCEACRRGLACRRCNNLIGYADDDPELLQRITDNLKAAQRRVSARMEPAI